MKKLMRFILIAVWIAIGTNNNTFAKDEGNFILKDFGKALPIVYSGKMYRDINTAEIEINDSNMTEGLIFKFPKGIKAISYNITDIQGLTGIEKGMVRLTNENANKNLNEIYIENITPTGSSHSKISIAFQIVASPDYSGDVLLTLEGAEETIAIAQVKPPIIIEAEKVRKKFQYRMTPETTIMIQEAYAGAMAEYSKVILDMKVDDMAFAKDCKMEVVNGAIEADCSVEDGNIIITVNKKLIDIPAEIKLSNVYIVTEEKKDGEYSLFSIAGSKAEVSENKLMINHGTGAMFETYSDKILDYAPVFPTKEIEVTQGFVSCKDSFDLKDSSNIRDNISIKIGLPILYIDGTERIIDEPAYLSQAGSAMLPLRSMADALSFDNAILIWNSGENRVTIVYEEKVIHLREGSAIIEVNGVQIPMDAPVELVNNRLFVPIRGLCHAFGLKDDCIFWDSKNQIVTIRQR